MLQQKLYVQYIICRMPLSVFSPRVTLFGPFTGTRANLAARLFPAVYQICLILQASSIIYKADDGPKT